MGQALTGKSVFGNVCLCLVGKQNHVTTTLRSLTSDQFEPLNLVKGSLITMADTEAYGGDLSVLKALTAGDPLRGRAKFKQDSFDFFNRAMVLIMGNRLFQSQDFSGALERRIGVLKANTMVKKRTCFTNKTECAKAA